MKLKLPQVVLVKALETIGRISTKHVTLPVLQCVLVIAEKGSIVLKATNLEIGIEIRVAGEVEEEGTIAVSAQTLLQSVQFLGDKELSFEVEEGVLRIEGVHTKVSIKTIPHDEFPTIHRINQSGVTINAELFALGIKTAAFAASQTSIKPELGSVFVQQKREQTLTFVATDSFRLMEKTVPQKGVVLAQSFLLPQKNALEIARICEVVGGSPELVVTENLCSLAFGTDVYVTTRLVTGSFPDYESIIPKEYVTTAVVLKDDLQKAFRKTNVFLNKFFQVTLAVTEKNVTVSATNSEVGHTTDTIKAQVEGQELSLSFNQQYVTDPLSHIQDDSVTLKFAGIGRPLIMVGLTDPTLRYLVMPMNK